MRIVGIDASGPVASCAVLVDGEVAQLIASGETVQILADA